MVKQCISEPRKGLGPLLAFTRTWLCALFLIFLSVAFQHPTILVHLWLSLEVRARGKCSSPNAVALSDLLNVLLMWDKPGTTPCRSLEKGKSYKSFLFWGVGKHRVSTQLHSWCHKPLSVGRQWECPVLSHSPAHPALLTHSCPSSPRAQSVWDIKYLFAFCRQPLSWRLRSLLPGPEKVKCTESNVSLRFWCCGVGRTVGAPQAPGPGQGATCACSAGRGGPGTALPLLQDELSQPFPPPALLCSGWPPPTPSHWISVWPCPGRGWALLPAAPAQACTAPASQVLSPSMWEAVEFLLL